MAYKYFLYSDEQIEEKNKILAPMSKSFKPGVVVVGELRKKFTQLSDTPTMPRFVDTQLVASGELSEFTYTNPESVEARGNK